MGAGRFRDFLVFEEKTRTLTAGFNVPAWGVGFNAWGEARRRTEMTAEFIIRYRPEITPDSHRILFWGSKWLITNAVPDTRRTLTIIECDMDQLVEATHLQSDTREFVEGLSTLRPRE